MSEPCDCGQEARGNACYSHCATERSPARKAVSADTPEPCAYDLTTEDCCGMRPCYGKPGSPTGSVVQHGSVGGASEDVSK